jgi:hypothetical protein
MPMCNALFYDALNLAIAAGDTVKVAFFAAGASVSATTATYSATNEVTQPGATPALAAGGYTLTGRTITASDGSVTIAKVDYDNPAMTPASQFTFQKIHVYNATRGNRSLGFHDYLTPQIWNAGTPYTVNINDLFTLNAA